MKDEASSINEKEEEDEDDDIDSLFSSNFSMAKTNDLGTCPPGCDVALYERSVAMRDKRLELEAVLYEEKKTRDALLNELHAVEDQVRVLTEEFNEAASGLHLIQVVNVGSEFCL